MLIKILSFIWYALIGFKRKDHHEHTWSPWSTVAFTNVTTNRWLAFAQEDDFDDDEENEDDRTVVRIMECSCSGCHTIKLDHHVYQMHLNSQNAEDLMQQLKVKYASERFVINGDL